MRVDRRSPSLTDASGYLRLTIGDHAKKNDPHIAGRLPGDVPEDPNHLQAGSTISVCQSGEFKPAVREDLQAGARLL